MGILKADKNNTGAYGLYGGLPMWATCPAYEWLVNVGGRQHPGKKVKVWGDKKIISPSSSFGTKIPIYFKIAIT